MLRVEGDVERGLGIPGMVGGSARANGGGGLKGSLANPGRESVEPLTQETRGYNVITKRADTHARTRAIGTAEMHRRDTAFANVQ